MKFKNAFVLIVANRGACLIPFPGCPAGLVLAPHSEPPDAIMNILQRWPQRPVALIADGSDALFCSQDLPLVRRVERRIVLADRLRAAFPNAFKTHAELIGRVEPNGTQHLLLAGIATGGPTQDWIGRLEQAGIRRLFLGLASVEWAWLVAHMETKESDVIAVVHTQASGMMRMVYARSGAIRASRQIAMSELSENPLALANAWAADIAHSGAPQPRVLSLMMDSKESLTQAFRSLRLPCRLANHGAGADSLLGAWVICNGPSLTWPVNPKSRPGPSLWLWILGLLLAGGILAMAAAGPGPDGPAPSPQAPVSKSVEDSPRAELSGQDMIHGTIHWPNGHDWQWPMDKDARDEHE